MKGKKPQPKQLISIEFTGEEVFEMARVLSHKLLPEIPARGSAYSKLVKAAWDMGYYLAPGGYARVAMSISKKAARTWCPECGGWKTLKGKS